MNLKKLLALFLIICILVTSMFTNSAYAVDDAYGLDDVTTMAQHLAGWEVDVEEGTLDYNCDGRVNLKDLVLLAQFVAGWNVVIGNGSNSIVPDDAYTQSVSADVVPVDGKVPEGGVVISNGNISATVPEGVLLNADTTTITLKIAYLNKSAGGVVAGENEELVPVDVHIEGVSKANTVPIIINMGKVLPEGLNLGNYKFFHVEDSVAKVMTLVDSADALTAHNTFTYDANTGEVTVAMATFSPVIVVYDTVNPWQGNEDASWYDVDKTELTITNADQLYSFAKIVGGIAKGIDQDSFNGKTVKLLSDINLNQETVVENGIKRIFYPVGYYNSEGADHYDDKTGTAISSGFYTFEGTFDGNGHTISNVYQNTWEMKGDHNWYDPADQHYRDGMGIFGKVYDGTVKNLTVDNFESDGEITTTGVIAAYADGATFENIAITNCNPRVYNIGNGGIVGCVGWYAKEADMKTTFKNITVDNSNKISALWGSYDVACGGIIGQYYPTSGQSSAGTPKNAGIHFNNCHVAAQMDVYNDVCGNYQYYAYRYAGILMGSVRENVTGEDGHVYPDMTGITAENCTVHFGTWNEYYYCEFEKNGHPSYSGPNDYKFSRVPHSELIFTDSNGNGKIDTEEERDSVTGCNHDHSDAEDNQAVYLPFNNLVTGYGWGVTSKAIGDMEGVTILDNHDGYSVDKFAVQDAYPDFTLATGDTITVGELFKAIDDVTPPIVKNSVQVFVSPVGEGNTVEATYTANAEDWTKGTIKFDNGVGFVNITITDYYFCNPFTVAVNVTPQKAPTPELNELNYDTHNWHMLTNASGALSESSFEVTDMESIPEEYKIPDATSYKTEPTQDFKTLSTDNNYGRTDNNSIYMSLVNRYVYVELPVDKINTDYTLTFYYSGGSQYPSYIFKEIFLFAPESGHGNVSFWSGHSGKLYYDNYDLPSGKSLGYTSPTAKFSDRTEHTPRPVTIGKDNWNKVEINFNSGNLGKLYLVLYASGASKPEETLKWIDDISLVENTKTAANDPSLWTSYYANAIGSGAANTTSTREYTTTDFNNIIAGTEGSLHFNTTKGALITTPLNTEAGKSYKISFKYKSDSEMYKAATDKYVYIRHALVGPTGSDYKDNKAVIISSKAYDGYVINYGEKDGNTTTCLDQTSDKGKWLDFEIEFTATADQLYFGIMLLTTGGNTMMDLYINNFKLEEIEAISDQ